ncbi:GNAT family N-acetyltransferase [Lysinibacillus fusiformis]|uniref:GNAT family N-acetyltransferase n=1 Tax=Lysinibacillus fusiformis TaxID=28031 RepID=UPI000887BE0A|nr:GNAT family N-acetyltransferase [Lysinibacillus fusiformis]PCD84968.1 GNAT family N-acetyltransferase [Lysinibacillus fusiformis]SCX40686.1 GNAT acetyltransferase [Lysinibacillus fusiformis]SDB09732.1 GNAT acetyltransferase [Lysinibacillus fusiformis]SFH85719.1 GNAT acetyltransferase [Lysinibacillus fusiformis]SFS30782.1 GNAT acetyltransferase [Lysinibacillus fusiformis]
MIVELDKADFSKCRELLNEQGQLEAKAVVERINPGRIFVDNRDNPSSGLIWLGNNDGFIFFGSEQNEEFNNELNNLIDNIIIPAAKKVQLKWFEGVGNHEKWNPIIASVFEHRHLGSWLQRVYTLQQGDYKGDTVPIVNHEYELCKISATLLDNKDHSIHNIVFLQSKIEAFWSSTDIFLSKGMGYCIIHHNEIVSTCISGFGAANVHGIDIETIEAHQRKNLAQTLAHHYVQECLKNNWIAYWDCMDMNKPSVAIAEKIGFRNRFHYTGYEFSL